MALNPFWYVYSHPKHLSYISETIGILGWVVAGPNPNQFIREAYNNGKHYGDVIKVLQTGDRLSSPHMGRMTF